MTQSRLSSPRAGKKSVSFFLLVFISVCAAFLGYGLAFVVFSRDSVFILSVSDPYAGCHLLIEFIQRTAVLCRPFLTTAALLLLIAYMKFAKTAFALFFVFHAIVLGISSFVVFRTSIKSIAYLPAVYAAVIAIYLIFVCSLHTKSGVRPLSESLVFASIASGAAGTIFTVVSYIFRQGVIS